MTIDTNELRRLAQAATPGPWHATKSVETNSWAVWSDTTRLMELRPTKTVDMYRVSNTAAFIAAANPAAISELLDRLEAAEKSDAESLAMYRKARDERDALRAKVEAMERQGPAYFGPKNAIEGGSTTVLVGKFPVNTTDVPLYALRGAQPAPSVPDGWQLVPIEPTEEMMMRDSSCQKHAHDDQSCVHRTNRRWIWKTMLAAAPEANRDAP